MSSLVTVIAMKIGHVHHRTWPGKAIRNSGESRNPVTEIINHVSGSFIRSLMDSGFRRSDECVISYAIALGKLVFKVTFSALSGYNRRKLDD